VTIRSSDVDVQTIKISPKNLSDRIFFNADFSRRVTSVESIATDEKRGNIVCWSGIKRVDCGDLEDRDADFRDSDSNLQLTNQRVANGDVDPGDSGGPVYRKLADARAMAAGSVVGGGEYPFGIDKEVYYSHIERIQNSLNGQICRSAGCR
jgi:hypothetical protein